MRWQSATGLFGLVLATVGCGPTDHCKNPAGTYTFTCPGSRSTNSRVPAACEGIRPFSNSFTVPDGATPGTSWTDSLDEATYRYDLHSDCTVHVYRTDSANPCPSDSDGNAYFSLAAADYPEALGGQSDGYCDGVCQTWVQCSLKTGR